MELNQFLINPCYITITNHDRFTGANSFEVGKIVKLQKDRDNFNHETLVVTDDIYGLVGKVATCGDNFAGTICDNAVKVMVSDYAYAEVSFASSNCAIARLMPKETVEGRIGITQAMNNETINTNSEEDDFMKLFNLTRELNNPEEMVYGGLGDVSEDDWELFNAKDFFDDFSNEEDEVEEDEYFEEEIFDEDDEDDEDSDEDFEEEIFDEED